MFNWAYVILRRSYSSLHIEIDIYAYTHLYIYIKRDRIKQETQTHNREAREEKNDNYQTSMISCSARRAFIIVDDSLPEGFVRGIWENVFKVRGIVFEDDNDEDNDESGWDDIGEEK